MTSPTARTLDLLRKQGYLAVVVERYNSFSMKRIDMYSIIDICAIRPDQPGVLGIQATSTSNLTARIKKAMESKELLVWLKAGNRFSCWGWSKKGKRGERKLWALRERDFSLVNENLTVSC